MGAPDSRVRDQTVNEYLPQAYTEYAMSVITNRSLPDVRDGLKPVQRRILYSLWDQGLVPDSPHKKSARTVGEVLGKYHPHGDRAVYDALVRMGQDFSLRYPLVDGQGNFGSVDGDPAAAMRYTEARLTEIAEEFFPRIDPKGSGVPWQDNFDGSEQEPRVLPVPFPNVLVNGASGIAVGMSTDIPPHNLTEILEATIHLVDHPKAHYSTLLDSVQGPDYPTGGEAFLSPEDREELYRTGEGSFELTGSTHVEQMSPERGAVVIDELPYSVQKSDLVDEIVDLAQSDDDPGISTVRDESDRRGMRLVVECRLKKEPRVILNNLLEKTRLKTRQRCSFRVLDDGVPKVLPLRDILNRYLEFMDEVLVRNTEQRKEDAEARLHIVRGLLKAMVDIDRVIEIVKLSDTEAKAREALEHEFEMTEDQSRAVLDRRIGSLTGMQQMEIEQERDQLLEDIEEYDRLLDSKEARGKVLKGWFRDIRDRFGDDRRTSIREDEIDLELEDLEESKPVTVAWYPNDYLRRDGDHRELEDLEVPPRLFVRTSTLDEWLVFSDSGTAYSFRVSDIPDSSRDERGVPVQQVNENITGAVSLLPAHTKKILIFTRNGYVKMMDLEDEADLRDIRPSGIKFTKLEEDDRVVDVVPFREGEDVFAVSENGRGIRFPADDLRPLSRQAKGVIAKKGEPLAGGGSGGDDHVVLLRGDDTRGAVKASDIEPQNRGGVGRYFLNPSGDDQIHTVLVSLRPRAARDGEIEPFESRSKPGGSGSRSPVQHFVRIEDWRGDDV